MQVREIYFHFGAHRTASTALQHYMRGAGRTVAGLTYLGPEDMRGRGTEPRLEAIERLGTSRLSKDELAATIDEAVSEITALGTERVVLANENLLGPMLGRASELCASAPRARRLIQALQARGLRVRGLLVVREQVSLLQSSYELRVSAGALWTPSAFLERLQLAALSWYRVADELRRALGDDLTIVPFELLRADPAAYFAALRAQHDIFRGLERLDAKNVAPSPLALFIVQQALLFGLSFAGRKPARVAHALQGALDALGPAVELPQAAIEGVVLDVLSRHADVLPEDFQGAARHAVRTFLEGTREGCHPLSFGENARELIRVYCRPYNVAFLSGFIRPAWRELWPLPA